MADFLRFTATFGLISAGGVLGFDFWRFHTEPPWTRDGRGRSEVALLAAFVIFLILRRLSIRTDFKCSYWRPKIVETALFLIILSAVAKFL